MSNFSLQGYVDVAQRIRQLREKFPQAVLRPANPAEPFTVREIGGREFIVYVAACYRTPDDPLPAIAVAAEPAVGATPYTHNSEVMNAETSAWGRAIMAALAVDEPQIASADEVLHRRGEPKPERKAGDSGPRDSAPRPQGQRPALLASPKQLGLLRKLAAEKNVGDVLAFASEVAGRELPNVDALTSREASAAISKAMELP